MGIVSTKFCVVSAIKAVIVNSVVSSCAIFPFEREGRSSEILPPPFELSRPRTLAEAHFDQLVSAAYDPAARERLRAMIRPVNDRESRYQFGVLTLNADGVVDSVGLANDPLFSVIDNSKGLVFAVGLLEERIGFVLPSVCRDGRMTTIRHLQRGTDWVWTGGHGGFARAYYEFSCGDQDTRIRLYASEREERVTGLAMIYPP